MDAKRKIAILINALTIVFEIIALAIRPDRYGIPALAFYTILSNLIALGSSIYFIIGVIKKKSLPFIQELRFCACCTLAVTFLVVVLCLVWFTDPLVVLFDGNNLYHHILIPIMTFYSYIFCESHVDSKKAIAFPLGYSIAYSTVLVFFNLTGKIDGPYPFFMTKRFGTIPVIVYCLGIGIIMYFVFRAIFKLGQKMEMKGKNV